MTLLAALTGDADIEALFGDEADLVAMLRTEAALAWAEADVDLIAPEAAARIEAVCAAFTPDWSALEGGMARDGVVIPDLIRQLREAVGERYGPSVHKGATSQDIVDTSLILRLQQAIVILEQRLDNLGARLATLAVEQGHRALMAHTRMQAALPFTVADKVASWSAPLLRHKDRLAVIGPRLLVLQLGGPVGTRTELGQHRDAVAAGMAARLGLGEAPSWHAQRDGIAEFGAWLSLVSGSLGKLGQDLALMAQTEMATVNLAGGGASSAMAHKQNPVGAEVLVSLARYNGGLVGALHQSLVHENERSGAAWTLEWLVLPRMVVTTGASLRTAVRLIEGLSFN